MREIKTKYIDSFSAYLIIFISIKEISRIKARGKEILIYNIYE
jgi:hypothetical protein